MNTKALVLAVTMLVATSVGLAVLTVLEFPGWNSLKGSQDIIIARCTRTPNPYSVATNGIWTDIQDGLLDADVQVLSVLKGAPTPKSARLTSQYWPRQGESYLIFSTYYDGAYQAVEPYRVIPLGLSFPTNMLAGKSLNEQIRALFQYRVDMLKREMEEAQEEKSRLEEGLKQ